MKGDEWWTGHFKPWLYIVSVWYCIQTV